MVLRPPSYASAKIILPFYPAEATVEFEFDKGYPGSYWEPPEPAQWYIIAGTYEDGRPIPEGVLEMMNCYEPWAQDIEEQLYEIQKEQEADYADRLYDEMKDEGLLKSFIKP